MLIAVVVPAAIFAVGIPAMRVSGPMCGMLGRHSYWQKDLMGVLLDFSVVGLRSPNEPYEDLLHTH